MKYIPTILAIILIAGSTAAIYYEKMTLFMGIFFILFATAKLIDLKGFKNAFSKYDILAKKFSWYGYTYPFIELTLGILYLFNILLIPASIITILIMSIGSIGVAKAVKKKIQCACLGTKIGVPLTHVTLFEDILMVIMAVMIIL